MNKKQMIKEQKKYKEQQKEVASLFKSDKDIYSNTWKISLGVILFFALSFCLINIINGNWNIFTKSNTNTEIDTHMVVVGTMFNKNEDEYIVMAYDLSKEENNIYSYLVSNYYNEKELYILDLSSGFNDPFIGEQTVISSDLEKLKFAGPTLLVIKGDSIVSSYTNEKDIVKYFAE